MLKVRRWLSAHKTHLLYGMLAGFIGLALAHYFSAREFWLDENLIYVNIKNRTYTQLYAPLDESQAFPRIYLCAIKWLGSLFNDHVLAIRFLPLMWMIMAAVIWTRIWKKLNVLACPLLSSLAFMCSYSTVYYAAEFKQYSMDVFCVALITSIVFWIFKNDDREVSWVDWCIAICIPWTVFISYGALFVFWMPAFQYAVMSRWRKRWRPLAIISLISAVAAGVVSYMTDVRFALQLPSLIDYWSSYYIDTSSVKGFLSTVTEGFRRLTAFWYGYGKLPMRLASVFIPFFGYALFRFGFSDWRKAGWRITTIETMGLLLFIELFVFGLLRIFPFTGERVSLFYAPFVFWLTVRGLWALPQKFYLRYLGIIYFSGVCFYSLYLTLLKIIYFYQTK